MLEEQNRKKSFKSVCSIEQCLKGQKKGGEAEVCLLVAAAQQGYAAWQHTWKGPTHIFVSTDSSKSQCSFKKQIFTPELVDTKISETATDSYELMLHNVVCHYINLAHSLF